MKRRDFIQKMSFGAAALSATSFDTIPKKSSPLGKKLGVALVGLGNYSVRQLAPALLETEHCVLRGLVTGSPEKAAEWSQRYAIPKQNIYNYQNFDTIRHNPDIDIVYIVLPNAMHAEYTIRAAKASKHIICEKPMAMNAAECEQMIRACKEAKVQLSVGYRLYFEPHHIEMRRFSTEKVHGSIRMMESGLGYNMADPTSWRLNKTMGGGGAIIDLGVYCINGVRRTLGELPIEITAQGFKVNKAIFKDIYEMVMFQMVFPSGAISNSTTTYSSFIDKLYATTEKERFGLMPAFGAGTATGMTVGAKISFDKPKYQQIKQMDAFALNILEKTAPIASGEEGLIDMKIIDALKEAADTGRKIKLSW
ncbi:MAG: Gfo/Idh/MocA family oxidoreductase [Saprospiraceae bacterium]|nr:Gfo/Idh/MocA family oxidoreductase [Saprospiraceae bacterium]